MLYSLQNTGGAFTSGAAVSFSALERNDQSELVKGDGGVMVFKVKGGQIEHLAGDGSSPIVTVQNVQALQSDGYNLLVLIFNNHHVSPFTGTKTIYHAVNVGTASSDNSYSNPYGTISIHTLGIENLWLFSTSSLLSVLQADYPTSGTTIEFTPIIHLDSCNSSYTYTWGVSVFGNTTSQLPISCGGAASMSFTPIYSSTADDQSIYVSLFEDRGSGPALVSYLSLSPLVVE